MSRRSSIRIVGGALVAALTLGPAGTARAFDDAAVPTITVYQPGGVDPDVLEAAIESAARSRASWAPIHRGTIALVSVTRGDAVVQGAPEGFRFPMSSMAIDAARARAVIGRTAAQALTSGDIVMGATSAGLRGAQVGDVITFLGWDQTRQTRRIGAIVEDELVSWAEIVFDTDDAESFGFERVSSLLLWGLDHRDDAIIDLWRTLPPALLRVDTSGDPWDPDSVLPTVLVKERFGEFAYRVTGNGDQIEVSPSWRARNIVTVDVPLLGSFRCHRAIVPYLRAAIGDVIDAGLEGLISFSDFQIAGGCWNPRLIRGGDKGGAVSRHAWGIGIDINPSQNPYGGAVNMHPKIVEVFRTWGFAWGGGWTFTDGGHFEWNHQPEALSR